MLNVGFKSDIGRVRSENQDSCFVVHGEDVFLLADGVGGGMGGKAGSTASSTAVSYIAENIKKHRPPKGHDSRKIEAYLNELVEQANSAIRKISLEEPKYSGMATTLVACMIRDDKAYFISAGDSRGYVLSGGRLVQITEDHSYVFALYKQGVLTKEEALNHKDSNQINKALGADVKVGADFYEATLTKNDIIILCSDGLYKEVSEDDIADICKDEEDMSQLAKSLIERANKNGGGDNVSVICIKYLGGNENE